jgi:hypothetical protein
MFAADSQAKIGWPLSRQPRCGGGGLHKTGGMSPASLLAGDKENWPGSSQASIDGVGQPLSAVV